MPSKSTIPYPATVNEHLFNEGVRHATQIQKYTAGTVKRIDNLLAKELLPDLQAQLKKRLSKIAKLGYDTGPTVTKRLQETIDAVNGLIAGTMQNLHTATKDELTALATAEAQHQVKTLQDAIGRANLPKVIDLHTPAPALLRSIVTQRPFQGEFLKDWYKGLAASTQAELRRQLKIGLAQGESIQTLTRRVRPVVGMTRRHTAAMVRTATNHVVTQAREETFKENLDVIAKVQYVSTLDARTTDICIALDGKIFNVDEGPRPPMHHQCRSMTIAVTKSWKELGIPLKDVPPSTRASMNGQVSATMTYPEWLKKQPVSVQNEVLGVGKAKLFREGKYKIDKYKPGQSPTVSLKAVKQQLGITTDAIPKPAPKSKPKPKPKPAPKPEPKPQDEAGKKFLDEWAKFSKPAKPVSVPTTPQAVYDSVAETTVAKPAVVTEFQEITLTAQEQTVLAENAAANKQWVETLSRSDKRTLLNYKGFQSASTGEISIGYEDLFDADIAKITKKAPAFSGTVYKGRAGLTPTFSDALSTPGLETEWKALTATTKNPAIAKKFGRLATEANTEWIEYRVKKNLTGTDISFLELKDPELAKAQWSEVVKPKKTRYKVVSRVRVTEPGKPSGWLVDLEEIPVVEKKTPKLPYKTSTKEGRRAFSDYEHSQWKQNLTRSERDAITKWSGGWYSDVRAVQRGQEPRNHPVEAVKKVIKGLDSAFKKAPIRADSVTYRGIRNIDPEKMRLMAHGETLEFAQYSSSSLDENVAKGFSYSTEDKSFGILKINHPDPSKGTGAYIQDLSSHPHELEVLYPPNSTFRVVSRKPITRRYGGEQGWYIEMEQI